MLRARVGFNHPNQGEDIIYRVHAEIFEALLKPNSKDGKALREAFGPRVMFRLKTAIAVEHKHSRIPVEGKIKKSGKESKDKTPEIVRTVGPADPPDRQMMPTHMTVKNLKRETLIAIFLCSTACATPMNKSMSTVFWKPRNG